ncbi:hypothetical protein [Nocardia brasiliensis]|uniref:hypothetical protein n=1 Tax=Nocardia brasiliensis TaxID=37326 RepID=UPI003D8B2087
MTPTETSSSEEGIAEAERAEATTNERWSTAPRGLRSVDEGSTGPGPSFADLGTGVGLFDVIRAVVDRTQARMDTEEAAEERIARNLAALADIRVNLRPALRILEEALGVSALQAGARIGDLATAAGLTPQGASDRWAHLTGDRIIVVISRNTPKNPPTNTYDHDRAWWYIGATVRELAHYAVIAEGGTVQRVYELDPNSWSPNPDNGKQWQFRAFRDLPLSADEVESLHQTGDIPYTLGSACPTKAGGAYRPERF